MFGEGTAEEGLKFLSSPRGAGPLLKSGGGRLFQQGTRHHPDLPPAATAAGQTWVGSQGERNLFRERRVSILLLSVYNPTFDPQRKRCSFVPQDTQTCARTRTHTHLSPSADGDLRKMRQSSIPNSDFYLFTSV